MKNSERLDQRLIKKKKNDKGWLALTKSDLVCGENEFSVGLLRSSVGIHIKFKTVIKNSAYIVPCDNFHTFIMYITLHSGAAAQLCLKINNQFLCLDTFKSIKLLPPQEIKKWNQWVYFCGVILNLRKETATKCHQKMWPNSCPPQCSCICHST